MSEDTPTLQRITHLHRWGANLLSFRLSRDAGFRFIPGQFARLGLVNAGEEPIWRAYSVASATYDDHLEFFSILVPGGAFSSRLQQCQLGDTLLVDKTCHGFLTTDRFRDGRHLWLLATGTGLAPFLSIIQDPQVWAQYERIVVVHSVRRAEDLAYQSLLLHFNRHPLVGEYAHRLNYTPIITREKQPGTLCQRIPELLKNGKLEREAALSLTPDDARIMICGNPAMVHDTRQQFKAMGYSVCRRNAPGQLVLENAF